MPLHFETIELKELALKLNDSRRVLIVDDEVRIADTLAAILNRSGFRTMVAYDGASALKIAQATPPDLLLSDVVMPGLGGVDLALAVRQSFPACKILLFSGQAATMDLLAGAREAGQTFTILEKPYIRQPCLSGLRSSLTWTTPVNKQAAVPRLLESGKGLDHSPTLRKDIA